MVIHASSNKSHNNFLEIATNDSAQKPAAKINKKVKLKIICSIIKKSIVTP